LWFVLWFVLWFGVAAGVGHQLITATMEFFPDWNDFFMSMLFSLFSRCTTPIRVGIFL